MTRLVIVAGRVFCDKHFDTTYFGQVTLSLGNKG